MFFNEILKRENVLNVSLIFKNTKTSAANERTRSITAASWILKSDRAPLFAKTVLLHEIAHMILFDLSKDSHAHNTRFQRVETALCKTYLNLIPIYPADRGYAMAYIEKTTKQLLFSWMGVGPEHEEFMIAREKF